MSGLSVDGLSRYATLSRQLSLFFKHYINNVCKGDISGEGGIKPKNFYLNPGRSEEYKRKGKALSIVYSGGDDVFVVGAWNEVIEFAIDNKISVKEAEVVLKNPAFSNFRSYVPKLIIPPGILGKENPFK